eukprot:TRINITY_DN6055_c0_g1_i1.p1 TRINITY_DN6055_c0_g1~~TRINITY_DN6055_c0_g1_i1.p1  ORF type:complete len:100 (+),score=35.78 TRINITY_DN6055_c0_g1_i1:63-362(+)
MCIRDRSRSVTIAIITTRELALKDFASEPDEQKLMKGTKLIVQNLAGSLALVTSREPLKQSLQKLSLIHISEPTRLLSISYAVFCLKKKKIQYYHQFEL